MDQEDIYIFCLNVYIYVRAYIILVQKTFFVAGYGLKHISLWTKLLLLKVSPVGQGLLSI